MRRNVLAVLGAGRGTRGVYVYVCVCLCVCVCMYVCMHVWMYVCIYVCTYIGLRRPTRASDCCRPQVPVARLRLPFSVIGLHRRSPTWHRRARATRSKARRRVRRQRTADLPIRRGDLLRLAAHHAGPSLLNHMGKRGQNQGWQVADQEWSRDHSWDGPRWQLWRGGMYVSPKAKAGQPWKPPGKGKGKKGPDNGTRTAFPSYDDRKPAEMAIVPLSEKRLEGTASGNEGANNIVRTVQSAVNQARKLDSKVQRLQREFAERKLQWDAYVDEMKQTLQKEKSRFISDQNTTAQALREAQEAQSAAHLQLQHSLVAKGQEPATADTTMGCEEWQDILQTLDAPPILSGSVNLQQLTQALLAAGVPLDTPERPALATPPESRIGRNGSAWTCASCQGDLDGRHSGGYYCGRSARSALTVGETLREEASEKSGTSSFRCGGPANPHYITRPRARPGRGPAANNFLGRRRRGGTRRGLTWPRKPRVRRFRWQSPLLLVARWGTDGRSTAPPRSVLSMGKTLTATSAGGQGPVLWAGLISSNAALPSHCSLQLLCRPNNAPFGRFLRTLASRCVFAACLVLARGGAHSALSSSRGLETHWVCASHRPPSPALASQFCTGSATFSFPDSIHLGAHGKDLAVPWSFFRSHGMLHSRVPKKRIGGSGTFTGCVAPFQPAIHWSSHEGVAAVLLGTTAGMGARNSDIGRSGVTAPSPGASAPLGPPAASVGVSLSETHCSAVVAPLLLLLALAYPVIRPFFDSPAYRAMPHHFHGLRAFLRVFSYRLGLSVCVHPVPMWSMGWCILAPSLWGVALLHAHLPTVSWSGTWIEMQAASVLLFTLCMLICGLLRLLLMPIGFHRTLKGRFILCGVLWIPIRIVLALDYGRATWTSQPPRRRTGTSPVRVGRWHSSIWVRLLCILALPGQVTAGPVGLFSGLTLVLSQLPGPACGMARPPQRGDPPHGTSPGLIAPEELTAHIGVCSVPPLGQRPQVDAPPAPELFLGPLGQQAWSAGVCPEDKMLGIYVYTPYYNTVAVALKFHGPATLAQACDVIRDRVPQVPVGPFDVVVPLRPQRFPEYPAFLRLPSIIKHQGADGHAGVVLDLTRVGGKYFATVLPKRLDYSILLQFVTPLTCHSELALCVYAAFFHNPWPEHVPLDLHDGDVLTFTHGPTAFVRHHIEPTFQPDGHWGALCHMPQVEPTACLCVMYGDKRFSLPSHHYSGETTVQATARCLGRDPHDLTMCAFPLRDLDLHGDACLSAITVVDQPNNRQPGTLHSGRRDIFVLCDLRPLGLRPRFVYTNYPAVHLPSILSQLGLRVPPIFKIKVAGGTSDRDDITVDGSVTLLFYAVLRSADATDDEETVSASRSNSDSDASAPEPLDRASLASHTETSPRDYEDLFALTCPETDLPCPTNLAATWRVARLPHHQAAIPQTQL